MQFNYGELVPDDIVDIFYNRIKTRIEEATKEGFDKTHPSVQREINRIISINGKIPIKIQPLLD